MVDEPERKRGLGRVLLGTAPGLERFLLATVPALIAGSLGYYWGGGWVGLGVGLGVVVLGTWLARRA